MKRVSTYSFNTYSTRLEFVTLFEHILLSLAICILSCAAAEYARKKSEI
ncbi:MAG: hypothetical protein PUE85_04920 [Firmicutes bacterium]|nr:hypothetical protein [Bacillota bacterium]